MRRPVEGEVHVHYGQIYVETDPDCFGPGLAEAFAGQRAGLCGAATPGALWLNTGLHTGSVGFTVEVHEQAPPLDPAWEDVVEVSFRPVSADSALVEWGGGDSWQLDLEEETDYRVRYCAQGMDQASERDTRMDGEPRLDCYLLQFWPAPPAPDRVLKQTSQVAAYWHRYARELPPPPTPAERAEAERQARLAEETAEREHRLAFERWEWGGQSPSQALRDVGGNVRGLLEFDPALVHAIDASGPATQRAVALFAARRACEAAGLTALDWVAGALTALSEGRPLPPPFDDDARMWETLATDPRVPDRTVGRAVPPERPPFRRPASPGTPVPQPLDAAQAAQAVVGPATAVANWQASDSGRCAEVTPRVSGSGPCAEVTPRASGSGACAVASAQVSDSGPCAEVTPRVSGSGPCAEVTPRASGSGAYGVASAQASDSGPCAEVTPRVPGPGPCAEVTPQGSGSGAYTVATAQGSGSGPYAVAAAQGSGSGPCAVASAQGSGSGPYAMAVTFGPPDPSVRMSQPHMALPAVSGAAEPDPLRAALDAVFAAVAAYGENHRALLAEVWSVVRGTARVSGP
ncbi:hypothetical protein [Streptomyces africanus]|uniref:hypothetical protein n=1 Tax=Streptomyces africanus TaxID=231024 RepID=UPI001FC98FE0|nr:hypothetical protein [Streptomyces africanus]